MAVVVGLGASCDHPENGIVLKDMTACELVANQNNEVIIFRSTGPWAKRWIESGFPTKNFHVKGKSSDWGPQAGLVPYLGKYSKVGYSAEKAAKGTAANDHGLHTSTAGKIPLRLTLKQLQDQYHRPEGTPPRRAVKAAIDLPNGNKELYALRSGDQQLFKFLAVRGTDGLFTIFPVGAAEGPLEVMTSVEDGLDLPMTGDYDLLSVCPSMADYGSLTSRDIVKPGIRWGKDGALEKGLAFRAGTGMDNVMDTRLHTMGNKAWHDHQMRVEQLRNRGLKWHKAADGKWSHSAEKALFGPKEPWTEHGDMGNLTPRILRCINALNAAMGATGTNGALRRVHHNAESHRNRMFGALTNKDMNTKKDGDKFADGFPFTIFQPRSLSVRGPVSGYGTVSTIESFAEFVIYATALKQAGYFVPKNWIWNV